MTLMNRALVESVGSDYTFVILFLWPTFCMLLCSIFLSIESIDR